MGSERGAEVAERPAARKRKGRDDAAAEERQLGGGGGGGGCGGDAPPAAVAGSGAKGAAKKQAALSAAKLEKARAKAARRGVVYLSRVPPFMKPNRLRQLLEPHGELGRLYLQREDGEVAAKRKREGGNSGRNFTEGWVEFADKRVAKAVAAALNGQPMGGKRRSAYYYDLWNIKYLPKFKWDHLTEEVAYQKAVREQKVALEVAQAKRERDFYLARVAEAKGREAMAERRALKNAEKGLERAEASLAGAEQAAEEGGERKGRSFRQRKAVGGPVPGGRLSGAVLASIFSGADDERLSKKRRRERDPD